MKYQLIFQFPESFFLSFDEIISFDNRLVASLPKTCDVDGHDIGSGTVNFFVYTKSPLAALKAFRKYLGTNKVEKNLRVSYREENGEDFINIWPFRDSRPFEFMYADGINPFSSTSKRLIPKKSLPGESKFETPACKEWPKK